MQVTPRASLFYIFSLTTFFASACTTDSVSPTTPASATLPATVPSRAPNVVKFVDDHGVAITEHVVDFCNASESTWQFAMHSPLGEAQFQFTVDPHSKIQVFSEHLTASLPVTAATELKKEWLADLCVQANSGQQTLILPANFITTVSVWLQSVSPDCAVSVNPSGGFRCDMTSMEPAVATQILTDLHKHVVQRGSRQPYLYMRRITSTTTLAKALQSSNVDVALDQFCKIVGYSLNQELPLALRSKVWRNATCQSKGPERMAAARLGLQKSVAEIELLRRLFEKTATQGFLSLKLPYAVGGRNQYWISLTPDKDVADNLAEETRKIWLKEGDKARGDSATPPTGCWHPMFAESESLFWAARFLTLTGIGQENGCIRTQSTQTAATDLSPERYLAESIASETEFPMGNGHAKQLRLPQGRYKYSIRLQRPENPDEDNDNAREEKSATGEIIWSRKGPSPVIKNLN